MSDYKEFEFEDFKYYWNNYESPLYLYRDRRFNWGQLQEQSYDEFYKKIREGIENIIRKYRIVSGK